MSQLAFTPRNALISLEHYSKIKRMWVVVRLSVRLVRDSYNFNHKKNCVLNIHYKLN
jgi:hypothetical protein